MQQNCKKGLCLAFLFSAMFLTGWEIAGMRSRQTKETAAVAYEAGNWGLLLRQIRFCAGREEIHAPHIFCVPIGEEIAGLGKRILQF